MIVLSDYFTKIIELSSFFQRFKGLMFKTKIMDEHCYILKTNGIHTFFMKFPIHAVYLNKNKQVILIYKSLDINKVAKVDFDAKYVIEFTNDSFLESINLGDEIRF